MRAFAIAVWVMMVAATGYALFHITFQVEALEGQLAELNRQIREEREHIHNLKAEWSYSTRLDWIEALGQQHLPGMERMQPAQALRIEDIPFRRPNAPDTGDTAGIEGPEYGPYPMAPAEAVPASLTRTTR